MWANPSGKYANPDPGYPTYKQWIADKIHRTTRFVSECWEKSYSQCFADYSNVGAKPKLSETSRDIIRQANGQQRKSGPVVAKDIAEKQKEYVTGRTVNNYRHREGIKHFMLFQNC